MHDLATFHVWMGNHDEAIDMLISLLQVYKENGWKVLGHEVSKKLAFSYQLAQKPKEFLDTCLSILHHGRLLNQSEGAYYISQLSEWSSQLTNTLDHTIKGSNSFIRDLSVISDKNVQNLVDGKLEIRLRLKLVVPKEIRFDSIQVNLVGGSGSEMSFEGKDCDILPGVNVIPLYCSNLGMVGDFVLETAKFFLNGLTLTRTFLQDQGSKKQVFKMNKAFSGIHIKSCYPSAYWTSGSRFIRFVMSVTLEKPLMDPVIYVSLPVSASGVNSCKISHATRGNGGFDSASVTDSYEAHYKDGKISLKNIMEPCMINIELPIKPFPSSEQLFVNSDFSNFLDIRFSYSDVQGYENVVTDRLECIVDIPISMKEDIFFNKDQSMVQIKLRNNTRSIIYLKEGALKFLDQNLDDKKVSLKFPVSQSKNLIMVPNQEISFSFKVTCKEGKKLILC
jgi:hypothetical protein